jgi:hypothetical protein
MRQPLVNAIVKTLEKEAFAMPSSLVDLAGSNMELSSGQQGLGGSSSGSTGTQIAQGDIQDALIPLFDMSAQVKELEADKMRRSIFGDSSINHNPLVKGITGFLAGQQYEAKLKPFLTQLQAEMLAQNSQNPSISLDATRKKAKDTFIRYLQSLNYSVEPNGRVTGYSTFHDGKKELNHRQATEAKQVTGM